MPFQHINRPSPFAPMSGETLPVWAVSRTDVDRGRFDKSALAWAKSAGFKAAEGSLLLAPNRDGKLAGALFGLGEEGECHPFIGGKLAQVLPQGDWHIETSPIPGATMALAFGMGAYRFEAYRKPAPQGPRLVISADADAGAIERRLAWPATWSTRRPMIWAPMRWNWLSGGWPTTTRRRSLWWRGTNSYPADFP